MLIPCEYGPIAAGALSVFKIVFIVVFLLSLLIFCYFIIVIIIYHFLENMSSYSALYIKFCIEFSQIP